ncbi:MAG: hypothetical protein LLF95_11380 [Bacteroidales bacterium]|nr:hypothetical protein [Bacteroidales bacterium]
MKKLIRYRIPVAVTFPAIHKRKGEPTYFKEKILKAIKRNVCNSRDNEIGSSCLSCDGRYEFQEYCLVEPKLHTCRSSLLWIKRFEKINRGEAVLELYYWSGKPYNSTPVVICQLGKDDGIGVQKIQFQKEFFNTNWIVGQIDFPDQLLKTVATNDGLSLEDFKEWFRKYDLSKPMAIIHFTKFRY